MDLKDAQIALDMNDNAGEILGYFSPEVYDDERAEYVKTKFNSKYNNHEDPEDSAR